MLGVILIIAARKTLETSTVLQNIALVQLFPMILVMADITRSYAVGNANNVHRIEFIPVHTAKFSCGETVHSCLPMYATLFVSH